MSAVLFMIPFLLVIPIGWVMIRSFLHFERSKKTIVEGLEALGPDKLNLLGLKAGPYVSIWETLPFLGSDWKADGLRLRDQMQTFQRVAIRGLPLPEELDTSVRKAARFYRRCFWIVGLPGLSLIYLAGSAKIGAWLGTATSSPSIFWLVAMLAIIGSGYVLPLEKFQKWPEVEDQT